MTRFRVVDPSAPEAHESLGDLADITIQATDAASPELPVGTELAVPEAFDPDTLFGVPVLEIVAISLDGRTWIPGRVAEVEMIVGSGKRVDFKVDRRPNPPKAMKETDIESIHVHVSRIFSVATGAGPTRRTRRTPVEDEPPLGQDP